MDVLRRTRYAVQHESSGAFTSSRNERRPSPPWDPSFREFFCARTSAVQNSRPFDAAKFTGRRLIRGVKLGTRRCARPFLPLRSLPVAEPQRSSSRSFTPWVLALFVGSGCAALVYEIVWFQLLQLTIGSTAASLGLLLATFMGGMCLGGLLWPRVTSPQRHPLRVYAALELGIGVLGLAAVFVIPLLRGVYVRLLGFGYADIMLRAGLCGICLLPPTVLMGATLPAIARWVEQSSRGTARLGFFYAGNTFGAVVGCLLAGFYLLRLYDMATAACVAAAINVLVAGLALWLAKRAPYEVTTTTEPATAIGETVAAWPVYATIGLSGLTALGAEVVWTRLLSLMLGSTVYAFSIILASFLVGIGLGSSVGSWWCGRGTGADPRRARTALGVCQTLAAAAILWAASSATLIMPHHRTFLNLGESSLQLLGGDLFWSLSVIVPAALMWGASFPLAIAAVGSQGDRARVVGGLYAANTAGAIVGSIGFSLWWLPTLGTQQAQQALIGVAALGAVAALLTSSRPKLIAITGVTAIGTALLVPQVPFELLAFGRYEHKIFGKAHEIYRGEGQNATIAVSENENDVRCFHICGRVEASSSLVDMRTQRMIGALPAVLHPKPESVLVVGFGAGVTAGSFLAFLETKRIVICEIEPLIPKHVGALFKDFNLGVAEDRATQIVYDDARHFVLTTDEKFDVITSDPIHPWLKGAAALYTVEYFESVKRRLNPGGVVSQWIPLYESNTDAVRSALASFFEVFPHGSVWTNARYSDFYDLVLVGSAEPLVVDLDAFEQRMQRPSSLYVRQLLEEVDFATPFDLLASYAAGGADLQPWLAGAEVNRDRNLRLQYLAGLTPRGYDGHEIHRELLRHRRVAADRFTGSAPLRERLERLMTSDQRKKSPPEAADAATADPASPPTAEAVAP